MTDVFGNKEEAAADKLAALIGEGKKYATPEEALNSLPFAQEHITNLETELAGLRSDLDKRLGAEEILKKLDERIVTPGTTEIKPGESTTTSVTKSGLTEEDVQSVVVKMRQEDAVKANRSEANKFVVDTYGEKATEVVEARSIELGMSVKQLQAIAENSPAAFKSLIAGTAQPATKGVIPTAPSQGLDTVNTQKVLEHGTMAYYENIRQTDPKTYWLPATQNELHSKAQENPDKFFGR